MDNMSNSNRLNMELFKKILTGFINWSRDNDDFSLKRKEHSQRDGSYWIDVDTDELIESFDSYMNMIKEHAMIYKDVIGE